MINVANGKLKVNYHNILAKINAMESIDKDIIFFVVCVVNRYTLNRYVVSKKQYCSCIDTKTNIKHRLNFCENLLPQPQKTLNSYQEPKLHEITLNQSL